MAKLYFRYGAMNSGKSTALLQAAYNYEERGQNVLLAKPAIDTKADDQIQSRLGMSRSVDFMLAPTEPVRAAFARESGRVAEESDKGVACLLIDEAQFLTAEQVDDLFRIAVLDDIPVLAYGIRTDFRTDAFPGSRRLLEIAHTLEELKTICRCGRKAIFNGRVVDGRFVFAGDQVAIDTSTGLSTGTSTGLSTGTSTGLSTGTSMGLSASGDVTYESLCGLCYLEESGGHLDGR